MNLVEREYLKPGHEYYIECLTQHNDLTITRNMHIEKLQGVFYKYVDGFSYFHLFRGIREPVNMGYDVRLGTLWNFYECKKHRIQQAMESRVLSEIMRGITGDEWFLPFV
jgi:hypothetical protein